MENKKELLGVGSRIKHPAFGDGVITRLRFAAYEVCFIIYGVKEIGKDYDKWEIVERIAPEEDMTFSAAEKSLMNILRKWSDIQETVSLGDKWTGGLMILQPKEKSLKPKEIPIETFFHKIVMLRDRIRVMEQRINSSALSDEEKINLQQYITRIYGSLTTFNVLFKLKEDYFVGDSKD